MEVVVRRSPSGDGHSGRPGPTMPDMGRRSRETSPDVLLELDEEYAQTLALLDRTSATQRIMANVPAATGVEVAWVGEHDGTDRVVLQHMVNGRTDGVNGL